MTVKELIELIPALDGLKEHPVAVRCESKEQRGEVLRMLFDLGCSLDGYSLQAVREFQDDTWPHPFIYGKDNGNVGVTCCTTGNPALGLHGISYACFMDSCGAAELTPPNDEEFNAAFAALLA